MITSQVGWWLGLERFKLGWDVLELVKNFDFRIVVLTKGPASKPSAWTEKVQWCDKHLKGMVEGITITHDKGLVYPIFLFSGRSALLRHALFMRFLWSQGVSVKT
jgi:hypothetical protein